MHVTFIITKIYQMKLILIKVKIFFNQEENANRKMQTGKCKQTKISAQHIVIFKSQYSPCNTKLTSL